MTLSLQNIYVYVSECMHVRAQDSQKRASAPLRLEYRQYELATSQVLDTEPRSSAEWPVLSNPHYIPYIWVQLGNREGRQISRS